MVSAGIKGVGPNKTNSVGESQDISEIQILESIQEDGDLPVVQTADVLSKNTKPQEKAQPVKSGKPNANYGEAFDLESSDGEPPQTSNGKVLAHKAGSVDDDD